MGQNKCSIYKNRGVRRSNDYSQGQWRDGGDGGGLRQSCDLSSAKRSDNGHRLNQRRFIRLPQVQRFNILHVADLRQPDHVPRIERSDSGDGHSDRQHDHNSQTKRRDGGDCLIVALMGSCFPHFPLFFGHFTLLGSIFLWEVPKQNPHGNKPVVGTSRRRDAGLIDSFRQSARRHDRWNNLAVALAVDFEV